VAEELCPVQSPDAPTRREKSGLASAAPRGHPIWPQTRGAADALGRGLQGAFLREGWKGGSTRRNPKHSAAPERVNRDFNPDAPNRLWVADLTSLPTGLQTSAIVGRDQRTDDLSHKPSIAHPLGLVNPVFASVH
jgi:hypothetical protein